MTEKRYFKRMWEEEYYIFDSKTISESDFEEKLEYQDYKAFEDSMMGDEVVNRLNEQHEQIQEQKRQIKGFILMKNGLIDDCMKLSNENEQLKQNIGIILKYCREKGKYAMDNEERKAHNVLQGIVKKELI